MSSAGWLLTTWDLHPSVIIGCLALLLAYALTTHGRLTGRFAYFLTADVVLALALVSVIDVLGDNYLFSVHMVQHLMLVDLVAPLLLLGTPPDAFTRLLAWQPAAHAEKLLSKPWLAWLIGMFTLWIWHLPVLYDAAVANESIHVVEHLLFLVSATIFWWPILTPLTERRLSPMSAFVYLMIGVVANSLLGILLTYAPPSIYAAYQSPRDVIGVLNVIRNQWHLSHAADQQLGGLIMWIPGGLIYLLAVLSTVSRWYGEEETDLLGAGAGTTFTPGGPSHV